LEDQAPSYLLVVVTFEVFGIFGTDLDLVQKNLFVGFGELGLFLGFLQLVGMQEGVVVVGFEVGFEVLVFLHLFHL